MTFDGLVSSRERTNEESKKTLRRFFSLSLSHFKVSLNDQKHPLLPSLSLFLSFSFPLFLFFSGHSCGFLQ